jgi:integrase
VNVRTQKYRLHRPTGKAVVTLSGRDHYLGKHGSPESEQAYRRLVAEWLANGQARPASSQAPPITIDELVVAFWKHCESYYRTPAGDPSPELKNIKLALRSLRRDHGPTPLAEFGPVALKAVRQGMLDAGLGRRTINQRIARIVRVFKFGVEAEMVDPTLHLKLKAVEGLKKGRSAAKEPKIIRPVADVAVDAVKPFVSRQVWAMIELQRLTGARSGEVIIMRTADIDRSGIVWIYTPTSHKGDHLDKQRKIFIGPKAQEILTPWLRDDSEAYLFQSREAKEAHGVERRRDRKTPLTPSQRARKRKAKPRRTPGERYCPASYGQAIGNACNRAFPHPALGSIKVKDLTPEQAAELRVWRKAHRWHPHQLRHSAATNLRKEFGLEAARVVLGHMSSAVTEGYAEVDQGKASEVMGRVG